MAATTARLSLARFVPGSIRRSETRCRSRSHPARAANERPEKLPFPIPTSLSAPPSNSSLLPPFRPPPPWPRAVSLDVEFSHYQEEQPDGEEEEEHEEDEDSNTKAVVLRVPADVAVVSDEGEVLLRALVSPPPWPQIRRRRSPPSSYRWVGGVPREEAESLGLDLGLVARELARLLSGGCLLVGHGVRGDLAALGFEVASSSSSSSPSSPSSSSPAPPLSIPASRIRDTSTSPGLLKRKNGHKTSSSTKLDELFARAFGLELRAGAAAAASARSADIPSPPSSSSSSSASRHDPVADAAAAMALYLTLIKGTLDDAASGAKELEEMETERLLQEFRARRDEKE